MNKLELNWIGKYDKENVINPEPRILVENEEYSYKKDVETDDENEPTYDNMLIHGDNLLALKSLESEYAGRIKCIYIDPPYNTGSAFEHYNDNLEHSTWLNLMKPRLELLKMLLADNGSIFIQIDDEEMAYLKVLCDEVFGRINFITSICIKMSHLSGVKMSHIEKKPPKLKEFVLIYVKNKNKIVFNPLYEQAKWNAVFNRYNSYLIRDIDNKEDISKWSVIPLKKKAVEEGININNENDFEEFCIKNSSNIFRTARNRSNLFENLPNDNIFRKVVTTTGIEKIAYKREEVLFCNEKMKIIDEKLVPIQTMGDIWTDIGINNLHNEGKVDFRNGKKPEKLIERILTLATNPGDLVLDSFLGSGTTAAVAQKMGRKWIGIELGEHAYTHCYPRLKAVVDGEQGGISKAVNWQGGGGFKFYELAPSLLEKSKCGNLVISNKYNEKMLAQALAKHEGYTYAPDENIFWKQGFLGDKNFIFTTPAYISIEFLDNITSELKEDEYLLIFSESFDKACVNRYKNIILRNIPKVLLGRCEWGKNNYNLNTIFDDIDDWIEEDE